MSWATEWPYCPGGNNGDVGCDACRAVAYEYLDLGSSEVATDTSSPSESCLGDMALSESLPQVVDVSVGQWDCECGVSSLEAARDGVPEDGLCVQPALLDKTGNMCCCWFDTGLYEQCESVFLEMFKGQSRYYVAKSLKRVDDYVLYGIAALRGRQVSDISHLFPPWVEFIYPIGDEEPKDFFFSILNGFKGGETAFE